MARTVRNAKLENRTSRLALEQGKRHWQLLDEGVALGYRRGSEGSGSWCVRVLLPDGRYTIQVIGRADDFQDDNGTDVLRYHRATKTAIANANALKSPHAAGPMTVKDAAQHYMEWFNVHRKSAKETQRTIDVFILPTLGDVLLSELKATDIRAWQNKLASTPARLRTRPGKKQAFAEKPKTDEGKRSRKATANRILTVLKAVLNKSFQDELVADDTPWRRVRPFPNTDEPITRFLTEPECIRLVNACDPAFRRLVKAALLTGARYGELVRLKVSDVDPGTRLVTIRPESKSGKARYVPMSDEGLAFFSELVVGKLGHEPVFTRENGEPWGKDHQIKPLKKANEQAKITPPVSFHELRHTYASHLARAGVDLLTISKLLGHADTRITARHYAHLCDKTLSEAVKKLPGVGHQSEGKVRAVR